MQQSDLAKAVGLAVLILVFEFALMMVSAWLWPLAIQPGSPPDYYAAAADRAFAVVASVLGPLLFVALIYLFSRRNPDRNAFFFAAVTFGTYLLLAGGVAAFQSDIGPVFLLAIALKFIGAFAGAALSSARSRR